MDVLSWTTIPLIPVSGKKGNQAALLSQTRQDWVSDQFCEKSSCTHVNDPLSFLIPDYSYRK